MVKSTAASWLQLATGSTCEVQQNAVWLKLLNFPVPLVSSCLFTGSRLTNALNINPSHSHYFIKFLPPANLTTQLDLCSVYT